MFDIPSLNFKVCKIIMETTDKEAFKNLKVMMEGMLKIYKDAGIFTPSPLPNFSNLVNVSAVSEKEAEAIQKNVDALSRKGWNLDDLKNSDLIFYNALRNVDKINKRKGNEKMSMKKGTRFLRGFYKYDSESYKTLSKK